MNSTSALDPQKIIFILLDKPTSLVYGFTVAEILYQRDCAVAERRAIKAAASAVQFRLVETNFPVPDFSPEAHESLAQFLAPELLLQRPPSPVQSVTFPLDHFRRLREVIIRIDDSLPPLCTDHDFIKIIKKWE